MPERGPDHDDTETGAPGAPGATAPRPEADWERRRRLAAVFGDVLPDTTRDERDAGSAPEVEESTSEAWLKAQRPPHHGG